MARVLCEEAIKYGVVILESEDDDIRRDGLADATETIRRALNHVRDMVESASRVEKNAEDKVSIHAVNLWVMQVQRAVKRGVESALPKKPKTAARIVKKIAKEIELNVTLPGPGDMKVPEVEGVSTTPSDIAAAMDESVLGE